MEFRIETNDEIKLLILTVSGDLSVDDVDLLAEKASQYEGKNYKCILDISGMEMIGMNVAGHAVKLVTSKMLDGFNGYCLVAEGSMFQLISMFAGRDFVKIHLADSLDEARSKLEI